MALLLWVAMAVVLSVHAVAAVLARPASGVSPSAVTASAAVLHAQEGTHRPQV